LLNPLGVRLSELSNFEFGMAESLVLGIAEVLLSQTWVVPKF
jgi:hypothetical protein